MAGIGFELKKIFQKRSITAKIAGAFYAVFSTIGNTLIIITVLVAVKLFLMKAGVAQYDQNLFAAIVLYSFVFPLVFSSGLCIVISRYIADTLWKGNTDSILASVLGVISFYSLFAAVPAVVFLYFAKLPLVLSFFAFLLYMLVGIIFILMVYVSALKDYLQIAVSFIFGMTAAFLMSFYFITRYPHSPHITTYLTGCFAFGMLMIACGIFLGIKKYFKVWSGNFFDFLLHMKKYPMLFIGNTLYAVALYTQNFVFWLNPATRNHVSIFIYSGDFDFAAALGIYTIMPSLVLFVVRTETSFYEYFRDYIMSITSKTGDEIGRARSLMEKSMWREFLFVFEVQVLISMFFLVVGMSILPKLGISSAVFDVFPYLTFGFLLCYFMFLATTILQYFENYADSLRVMVLFFTLSVLFNVLSVLMGYQFYGLGIIFSAAPAFALGLYYLKKTMNEVNYRIFCSGTLRPEEKTGFLDRLVARLNGREEKQLVPNSQQITQKD